ncbi:ABC transporter ATP-binding protein [Nocardioides panacisoli]|uniref:ABC transporter ATP-binding protein n=1 Tax=Nocardioides panacisoli TaxID=627624 RepID=UPI001C633C2F|nr:ABC transporter ATP-binding protein [Nocardioides panacisoli]QYJ04937.1 ABC transporter ATP-binding protein [Nocardioides panacisoli]
MSAALSLSGVDKHYGDTHAVRSLDLAVEPGEIVTVVGESGCGKSTLLRLVAGLEAPDAGSVAIDERVVADARTMVPPERRRVGMVFQDHALFPHLDVAANIGFGLRHLPATDRAARIAEVLDIVGLAHVAARHPHQLSGGEQQRVALARALAPAPAAVLLDEPFSSLDENLRARVRVDTLDIMRRTGSAALVVTHDQDEALMLGDRVAVLRSGRLEQVDTPAQVFEHPANRYVATFMGDADFLPGRRAGAVVETEVGPVAADDTADPGADAEVDVMLRPHQVMVSPDPGGEARVARVEYHGAYTLHELRLPSGRHVRSRQPGATLEVGAAVRVGIVPEARPAVVPQLVGLSDPTTHIAKN